jgi:hypothetical protein
VQIYAYWAIVFFGHILTIAEGVQGFVLLIFHGKSFVLF